jgi:hypothetical protein
MKRKEFLWIALSSKERGLKIEWHKRNNGKGEEKGKKKQNRNNRISTNLVYRKFSLPVSHLDL